VTVDFALFGQLDADHRRRMLARMHRSRFAAGEVVFHEGDPADTVHFVVEGRVVARRSSESGDRLAYAVIGPGEAFGELAMLAPDRRRTTTIQAFEPTVTMSLSYGDFTRLRMDHPSVEGLLVTLLAERVARLTDGLMEALHVPADQRVARRLVELCGLYTPGDGLSNAVVPLTQTDLSELSGVTRPTANRVLRRLAAVGALELSRGAITVLDDAAVRRAAGLPPVSTLPLSIT
jgi:CRP-like cAMP-binding protein